MSVLLEEIKRICKGDDLDVGVFLKRIRESPPKRTIVGETIGTSEH